MALSMFMSPHRALQTLSLAFSGGLVILIHCLRWLLVMARRLAFVAALGTYERIHGSTLGYDVL